METCKLALLLGVCATVAFGFTCPEDSHTFYHADVSTGCQVYHLCENSQLQTLSCPSGKAFNYVTSKCEDATTVDCRETSGDHANHHHHKRSAIQQQRDTFDYHAISEKFIEAFQIQPNPDETFEDFQNRFEKVYMPTLRKIKSEALLHLSKAAYPEFRKFVQALLRFSAHIVESVYKSYELSNSTHIAVVSSIPDIVEEVSKDVQPVLRLRRHLSHPIATQLSQFISQFGNNENIHVRSKREAAAPIPEFLLSLIRPVVNNMIRSVTDTIFGNLDSFTAKVIMPTIYDIFGSEESRYNMLGLWLSAKSAYSPFLWEMMKRQKFDTPEGTIIHIPRHLFEEANSKFRNESKPFLYKIAEMHLPTMLKRASENVPALLDGIRQFDQVQYKHSGVLQDAIVNFLVKHGSAFQKSTSSHISTYTLTEIMNDLRPIKINVLKLLMEFYKQNKDSFLNVLFGPDSILNLSITEPEVYAEPQKPQKPQKVKDSKAWGNY